jgi:Na+/melibiose symporter-like transporter
VLASSRLNWFYNKFGRKTALSTGTIIAVVSLGSMLLLSESSNWVMYIIAIFIGISCFYLGISQTMVLSTGINFISDVVGSKAKTGAFVFGIYSLLDKFSAGIVIFLIGNSEAYTKDPYDLDPSEVTFIKYTMVLIPALSAVLATLIVISYPIQ